MTMIDDQNTFSRAQVLTATANSTDYLDPGATRNLGSGEAIKCLLNVAAVSGTSPTLAANLVGADDIGFSTNKITIGTLATLSPPVAGTNYHIGIPSHAQKRYFRIEYTVGGTGPSITVTAMLVKDEPTTPMT
jgi:hypothetical protein